MAGIDRLTKLKAEIAKLEPDYHRYSQPEVMIGLKGSVLDQVWDIFGMAPIAKMEAAPFVVGRLFQALEPYREALYTLKRYEEIESELAKTQPPSTSSSV